MSAEGRVEHQKQNQTATFQWPVGFVFGLAKALASYVKSKESLGANEVMVLGDFAENYQYLIQDEIQSYERLNFVNHCELLGFSR